jgi:hypothetical protein
VDGGGKAGLRTEAGLVTLTGSWTPPRLDAVLSRQGGVFTAAQAYAAGASPSEVQEARRRRDLVSLRRGIYAVTAAYEALDDAGRYRLATHAALLALKPPTALSHVTAAQWDDLELLRPDLTELHVTRPELVASRREAGIHHHPGALPTGHVEVVRGVRITSALRTAVDLARTTEFAEGLAAADSALRRGHEHAELLAVLDMCRAWPGARQAGRVVAEADGRTANPGESWSRAILIQAGLAPTDLQVEVRDRDGLVGYADFGWLPSRVLGEFDGRGKYGADASGAADAVWREKLREDRLRALGFIIVRWTWADLLRPERFLGRIRNALAG